MILRRTVKIVATKCQILRLKCTKIDFGWGSAPDPVGGAYSAPPAPLAGFKGPTSEKGREGREREGRGRSTCLPPRFDNPGYGRDGFVTFSWLVGRSYLVIL